MADDLGYGDLGCYGNTEVSTPNIDALAAEGLKLTDFHSNGVVCSPSRVAVLTGMYPQEAGIEGVVTAKSHRETGMSLDHLTMAEFLKDKGYETAIYGKWHLGYQPEFGPINQGFDHFVGFVSGNVDYFSHIDQEGYEDWWFDQELQAEEGYLTERHIILTRARMIRPKGLSPVSLLYRENEQIRKLLTRK
jgi:arylsulfatase A